MNQSEMMAVNEISMTDRVRKALAKTLHLEPTYYTDMLRQRSEIEGGIGSVYPDKSEKIESMLLSIVWTAFESPDVMPGCVAAKAKMPGKLGVVDISKLPETTTFVFVDPKKTGFCEILVEGNVPRREVEHTVIIMGKHESGEEIVYTFHPGDPVMPSRREGMVPGGGVTMETAKTLGFKYAKVA